MTLKEALLNTLDKYCNRRYDMDPRDINRGECAQFARTVQKKTDSDVQMIGDARLGIKWDIEHVRNCGHVWVTDGDRHYDSECLEGVEDYTDLPHFNRGV